MIRVNLSKEEDLEKNETEVHISVSLNTPLIEVDPFLGIYMKDSPNLLIGETAVSFNEMGELMNKYDLKNWFEVRHHIEEMYYDYYKKMFDNFKEFKSVKIRKVEEFDKTETQVLVSIFLKIPQLALTEDKELAFSDEPQTCICKTSLSFKGMKDVMDEYELKNWKEVRKYIEEKYLSYYIQMFQDFEFIPEALSKKAK